MPDYNDLKIHLEFLKEEFEILNERTRWKDEVQKGNISDPSKLVKKGIAPSEKKWLKGVEKGSDKIFKKAGTKSLSDRGKTKLKKTLWKLLDKGVSALTGPMMVSMGDQSMLYLPKGMNVAQLKTRLSRKDWTELLPLLKRHEANELTAFQKQAKKGMYNVGVVKFKKDGKLVGQHAGPSILKKEKEMLDYWTKLYGPSKAKEKWNKVRAKTGEYGLVKNKSWKDIKKDERQISKTRIKNKNEAVANFNKSKKELLKSKKLAVQAMRSKEMGYLDKAKQLFASSKVALDTAKQFKKLASSSAVTKVITKGKA